MESTNCANCSGEVSSSKFKYATTKYYSSYSPWNVIFTCGSELDQTPERMIQFCHQCQLVFNNIYQSKIAFLDKTKEDSIISRIHLSSKVDKKYDRKRISQNGRNSTYKSQRESMDEPEEENGECILPASFNDENPEDELPEPKLPKANETEMEELFPTIQIQKLDVEIKANSFISFTNEPLICSKCGRQFLTTAKLSDHETAVHLQNISQYKCSFCTKTFQAEWFYKQHLRITHSGIKIQFKCDICEDKFYSQSDLQNHKMEKHDIRTHPFNCNHCLESFDDISNLRNHLSNEHGDTEEAKAAAWNVKLIEEWKKSRNGIMSCPNCPEKFYSGLLRRDHVKSEHNGKCACKCGKSFDYAKWVVHDGICVHKFKEGDENCKFKCEMCGRFLLSVSSLKPHYRLHVLQFGPTLHFCNLCSISFLYPGSYNIHMKKVHGDTKTVPYKCECLKKFKNSEELKNHSKTCNYIIGSFSCDKCNKKFKSASILEGHKRWHDKKGHLFKGARRKFLPSNFAKFTISEDTKEVDLTLCYVSQLAQFSCPVSTCQGIYYYKFHLTRHLRKFHDIKGFTKRNIEKAAVEKPTIKCLYCPLMFTRKDRLSIHHSRYHRNERHLEYHTCQMCHKKYDAMQIMHHYNRHSTSIAVDVSSLKSPKAKTKQNCETNQKDLNDWYDVETKSYKCSINNCTKECRLLSEFVNHCKTDHKCEISKVSIVMPTFAFQCARSGCEKNYPTKLQLREHLKNHKRDKVKLKSK